MDAIEELGVAIVARDFSRAMKRAVATARRARHAVAIEHVAAFTARERDDLVSARAKRRHEMRPQKTGRSRHEVLHEGLSSTNFIASFIERGWSLARCTAARTIRLRWAFLRT